MNGMCLVLFGKNSRIFGPCLAAIGGILISVMEPTSFVGGGAVREEPAEVASPDLGSLDSDQVAAESNAQHTVNVAATTGPPVNSQASQRSGNWADIDLEADTK
jgi:hypothetical protein